MSANKNNFCWDVVDKPVEAAFTKKIRYVLSLAFKSVCERRVRNFLRSVSLTHSSVLQSSLYTLTLAASLKIYNGTESTISINHNLCGMPVNITPPQIIS